MPYSIPTILIAALALAPSPALAAQKSFLSSNGGDSRRSIAAERRHEQVQSDPRWNTIWTFYAYPGQVNHLTLLNLDTWRHHAPHMNIVLLNNSNIRDYVPDLPEEFFRLVLSQAKSDVIRAAVLYHQGGVYMDTDFLLMKPLTDVLEKLEDHDVVAYANDKKSNTTDCGRHFTSNFMAARKGNRFSKTWWRNMKAKMTRVCEDGQIGNCERVCCHERSPQRFQNGTTKPEKRGCYVPFGAFEHMKVPDEDHDRSEAGPKLTDGRPETAEFIKNGKKMCSDKWGPASTADLAMAEDVPKGVRTYCLKGDQSLSPHLSGQVFWAPWNPKSRKTISLPNKGLKFTEYDDRFNCNELVNGSLSCSSGNWGTKGDYGVRDPRRIMNNFFGRHAYHLFFSTFSPKNLTSKEQILQGDWLVSELYRRSLSA